MILKTFCHRGTEDTENSSGLVNGRRNVNHRENTNSERECFGGMTIERLKKITLRSALGPSAMFIQCIYRMGERQRLWARHTALTGHRRPSTGNRTPRTEEETLHHKGHEGHQGKEKKQLLTQRRKERKGQQKPGWSAKKKKQQFLTQRHQGHQGKK